MSITALRDIAPEFKQLLSELPLDTLDYMQNRFVEGLNNKDRITRADQAIIQSFQAEKGRRITRQYKAVFLPETKKCLHCNTYHPQNMQHCPECGRYLYACGDIYQPKTNKRERDFYVH